MIKGNATTGVDSMARSFSTWSHVVGMLFAQLTHAIGLNDVCDARTSGQSVVEDAIDFQSHTPRWSRQTSPLISAQILATDR
jgi:uncharacterized protein DUF4372